MFAQMFPCLPYLETLAFIAETKVASRKAKIFPTNLETFDETLFLRWGGGVYSYIRVLPDGCILKSIVFTVCKHEYTPPPPPQLSCLATALDTHRNISKTNTMTNIFAQQCFPVCPGL